METVRTLGNRIAEELRAELGRQERSRRWLSSKTGIPHVTVARYIKGASAPNMDDLDAICRALGLSIPDLLQRVERNGGYDPKPVGDALDPEVCAIGDSNAEPADSWPMPVVSFDALWPRRSRLFRSGNLPRYGLRPMLCAA